MGRSMSAGGTRRFETTFTLPVDLPVMTQAQHEAAGFLREKGASEAQIEGLRRRLRVQRETLAMIQSNAKAGTGWPTPSEERKELTELADLADALRAKLRNASPRVEADIATAAMLRLGDVTRPAKLVRELALLAQGIRERVDKVPAMPKAPVGFVRAVVEVLGSVAGDPSKGKGTNSTFMKVCKAAFVLAGWNKDPKRAVEAYIESLDSQGDTMG
jgi:hypothetical protein